MAGDLGRAGATGGSPDCGGRSRRKHQGGWNGIEMRSAGHGTGVGVSLLDNGRGDPTQTTWAVHNLYLPPDGKRAAADAYIESIGGDGGALYVGCDVNLQLHRPRNDDKQDDAVRTCEHGT